MYPRFKYGLSVDMGYKEGGGWRSEPPLVFENGAWPQMVKDFFERRTNEEGEKERVNPPPHRPQDPNMRRGGGRESLSCYWRSGVQNAKWIGFEHFIISEREKSIIDTHNHLLQPMRLDAGICMRLSKMTVLLIFYLSKYSSPHGNSKFVEKQ